MATWEANSSRQINQRLVIIGTLTLDTPASFGNGETNGTELVILKDALEHRPLIPGASLAGALRHYLLTREVGYRAADFSDNSKKTLATLLFGEALNDATQRMESRVIVSDALGKGLLMRREGVKIEQATRTADEGMLFSSQVWEAGTTFDLRFELILYEGDPNDLLQAFAATLFALGSGEIPMGGRKQRGYGRVHVNDWRVCFYDLANPVALSAWLCDEFHADDTQTFFKLGQGFDDLRQFVRVKADLRLCESLLIRAPSDVADNEQLSSRNQPTLSGTSLAGALRARALKIANTVNATYAVRLVDDLFGQHGTNGDSDKLTASRVLVAENPIQGGTFDYIQNRVKIDRFTGGAFETALFSERPVFANGNTSMQISFELRYPANGSLHTRLKAQTGLLLLTLKDLWTEDLPLGGDASIGRGRLHGESATLELKTAEYDQLISIELNEQGLSDIQHLQTLQSYVQALWDYRGDKSWNEN